MGLTVLALIMTVFMGGLIAYNGDLIGRKFGKRRVTMLGLRPKHTAILITSVTGIFISALTTGVLFMLVKPVRTVILEGEEAIRQMPILKQQKRETEQLMLASSARAALLQNDIAKLTTAKREVDLALGSAQKALKASQQQQSQIKTRLEIERSRLAITQAARAKGEKQIATLTHMSNALARENVGLNENNSTIQKENTQLIGERTQLTRNVAELRKQQTQLAKENHEIQQENEQIAATNEKLNRENTNLSKQNEVMVRENARLTTANDGLFTKNKELTNSNAQLMQIAKYGINQSGLFEKMRTGRIAVHRDEDLARNVIPKNVAPDVVLRRLEQLMHDASVVAREKGATASEGGGARAVEVVDKQFYAASSNGGPIPVHVTANERIQAVVNSLAWSESPVCVLALAVANSVEGEPAAIDFQPFPERLIYSKGYIVGSRRFDANSPAEKLYAALTAFLKDLGKDAIDRGMIPRMDPVTGESQVGSMDLSELVDVVERMRARNRPVKVTALAREDLNASEPLKLSFRIENSL